MISAWMLYGTGVSLLLGCSALALERVLGLYGRATRWAWAAAILAGPFLLAWAGVVRQPQEPVAIANEVVAMPIGLPASPPAAVLLHTDEVPSLLERIDPLLLSGWAVISLALFAGLAFSLLSLRRQRHTWRHEEVCGIPVLISRDVGPATVGFFRTAVVLPEWVLSWDDERKNLVLAHEQEHIRAGDPRLFLLAIAAVILTPWNPALWWQLRRLRLAMEVDCDARILRRQVNVRSYGTLLLDVGHWSSSSYLPVTAFSQPRSFLERRIRAMTAPRPHRPLRTATLLCTFFALGLGTAASMPAPDPPDFLRAASDRLHAESPEVSTAPESAVLKLRTPDPGSGIGGAEETPTPVAISPQAAVGADTLKPILQNPDAVQRALVTYYPPLLRDVPSRVGGHGQDGVTADASLEGAAHEAAQHLSGTETELTEVAQKMVRIYEAGQKATMRTQFDETHALIRRAVQAHYPEAFSRGLSRDKYLWFLVAPSGQIEQTGVASVEWEPNGWSSTSITRTFREMFPETEVQHSHHTAGLKVGGDAKVNVAWITRT